MTSTFRRAIVPGIAVLAIAVSACGSGGDSSAAGGDGAAAGGGALSGTLNGGGSSAQTAAQSAWMAGFQQADPGVTVNYDPVGSGTGRTNFFAKSYSFAGSDSALSDDTSAGASEIAQAKERCGGTDALEVPVYISPIAVVYHLSGVDSLNLAPATVAGLMDGSITTWDDPQVAADNPGVSLPSTKVTPVHRSDDSGTTDNFTDWLAQTAGGDWKYPADDTWPIQGGASGDGTSGLVDAIKGGEGAIGYADFSQSGGLGVASIGVGDTFTAPSAEGAATALADSPVADGRPDGDLAISIDRTDTASGTYPLILTSYLIACQSYSDNNEAALVKGYLSYAVSSEGQQAAAAAAGSAPLPSDLASKAAGFIDKIAAG